MGLFDNLGKVIFGSGTKVEAPYETLYSQILKDNLHKMATANQNLYDPNKQFSLPTGESYDTSAFKNANNAALSDYKNQFGSYQNTMNGLMDGQLGKGYTDQLNNIRDNNLQLAQNQIGKAANEQIGGLLSGLANRGVINSSVMSDSGGQIGKSAANAMADAANRENINYNNSYLNSLGQSANMAGSLFSGAGNVFGNSMSANNANLQGDMAGQQFDMNKLQSDMNRYGFNQNYNNQAFQNAWSPLMQMYQIEQGKQPIITPGTQGLLGSFASNFMSSLGSELGYQTGRSPFDQIGSLLSSAGGGLGAGAGAAMASDKRLKTDIRYTGEVIDDVPVATFKYKNNPETIIAGFIAQDVMKIHPERVTQNENGYYMIYPKMFSRMPVVKR